MSAVATGAKIGSTHKFKDSARIPRGVTVEGVLAERRRIVEIYGRATARESAEAVLADPDHFPNLRAFAPESAEEALRLCVERGVRHAFASIVEVETISSGKEAEQEIEVRMLHAVPVDGDELSYEPLAFIKEVPEQKTFLITQLRKDARTFADKMETVLSEIERLL